MSIKKNVRVLILVFAVLHLVITSIFLWTDIVFKNRESVGRWFSLYMNYVGSTRDYSFFAPSVSNSLRALCVVNDSSGTGQIYKLETPDKEANFRFDCLIASCMRKQEGMDMFSQSWAAFYLSHHPHSIDATIVCQSYQIPSMKAYQKGEKPYWETFYTGTFMSKQSGK